MLSSCHHCVKIKTIVPDTRLHASVEVVEEFDLIRDPQGGVSRVFLIPNSQHIAVVNRVGDHNAAELRGECRISVW